MQAEESGPKHWLNRFFTFWIDASIISLAQFIDVLEIAEITEVAREIELKQIIEVKADLQKA